MATSQPRFICVFIFSLDGDVLFKFFFFQLDGYVIWAMRGDKSTTLYLCFYLLIRQLHSVGHVWRQVNHVLFVFLSFNQTAMYCGRSVATSQPRFIFCFYLLIDGYLVWRQVNHVLFVCLSFN